MGRLFGTDGVRGKAGDYPLDVPTVRRLGAALARSLGHHGGAVRFLAGRDTRESGSWIERELAFGMAGQGAQYVSAGVIPTPAIAYLTPRLGFTAGVVISASHNPFADNGIKVFSGSGEKFTEALEREVEALMADSSLVVPEGEAPAVDTADYRGEYEAHLRDIVADTPGITGIRVGIDCANGATTTVAPELFEALGVQAHRIGCEPDGRNINLGCGSTAPQGLARLVVDQALPIGIAYDGDGDRAIFVDERGSVVDGDAIMLICAKQLRREGRLKGDAIVATVMSNIGLEIALRGEGIGLKRCPVGDKYVMEEMARQGLSLGGEQSGHIIFSDYLFTGDGLATSLQVLRTLAITGRSLADLAAELTTYPQVLLNVRVPQKVDLATVPDIALTMADVEARLAGNGRLLVRYSGTEPLLRIMIEGQDQDEIAAWAEEIAASVRQHLVAAV
jgi:phosphoglucosamine mutase